MEKHGPNVSSLFEARYLVRRQIGAGVLGDSHWAIQKGAGFERPVVLERLERVREEDKHVARLFLKEMRYVVGFQHPNIVRILDIGLEDGHYYVATEAPDGRSLERLIEAVDALDGRIGPETGIAVALQILAGLHYAHRFRAGGRRIEAVHGGLSPQNVIVSEDGVVVIRHFGLIRVARFLSQDASRGDGAGYMAPEMAKGELPDHRSDIYSVGMLLYRLTVGPGGLERERSLACASGPSVRKILPPTYLVKGYPPRLEQIVMQALEGHADERYDSAEEMLSELEDFAFGAGLRCAPWDLGRQVRQVLRLREERAVDAEPGADELGRREAAVLGRKEDALAFEMPRPKGKTKRASGGQPAKKRKKGAGAGSPVPRSGRKARKLPPALPKSARRSNTGSRVVPKPLEHTVMVTSELVEGESDLEGPDTDFLHRPLLLMGATPIQSTREATQELLLDELLEASDPGEGGGRSDAGLEVAVALGSRRSRLPPPTPPRRAKLKQAKPD